jgi:uncharacterized RmlC-like cupin family protein
MGMFADKEHTFEVSNAAEDGHTPPADKADLESGRLAEYTVRVVKGTTGKTAQSEGMVRRAAIDKNTANSKSLWFGRVTCPPGLKSVPHHHGPAETAGHMLSGDRIRVYFGEGYQEFIEVEPGDYLFVPAYIPHIEMNMSDVVAAEFVTARSPDNIVVNIEEED